MYWPDDNQFYSGEVTVSTGKCHVDYQDGDKEYLKIKDEIWRYPREVHVEALAIELKPGVGD